MHQQGTTLVVTERNHHGEGTNNNVPLAMRKRPLEARQRQQRRGDEAPHLSFGRDKTYKRTTGQVTKHNAELVVGRDYFYVIMELMNTLIEQWNRDRRRVTTCHERNV